MTSSQNTILYVVLSSKYIHQYYACNYYIFAAIYIDNTALIAVYLYYICIMNYNTLYHILWLLNCYFTFYNHSSSSIDSKAKAHIKVNLK